MVQQQLMARGIKARKTYWHYEGIVPREEFVPEGVRSASYQDRPLRISYDQTISQPYIVALMTEKLRLTPKDRVLEIGTGSGYQAAILGALVAEICSIEIIGPRQTR